MKEDAAACRPTPHAQISNFSLQLHPTLTEMTEFMMLPLQMQNVLYNFSHRGTDTLHLNGAMSHQAQSLKEKSV